MLVGCVHDGLEVPGLVKNNDVDVLVMDLVLPTIDGIGVLERINRMQLNKRPHVLISKLSLERDCNVIFQFIRR